jgi:hypothetical protein
VDGTGKLDMLKLVKEGCGKCEGLLSLSHIKISNDFG